MISLQAHLIKFWYEKCLRIIERLSRRRGVTASGSYPFKSGLLSLPPCPPSRGQGRASFSPSASSNRCAFKKQTLRAVSAVGFGDFSVPVIFLKWEHQGGKRRKSQQIASSEQGPGRWLEAPGRQGHCSAAREWGQVQAAGTLHGGDENLTNGSLSHCPGIWDVP